MKLYYSKVTFMRLLLSWRMFITWLSSRLRNDFSASFRLFYEQSIRRYFNHALEFCEFYLGFEIFSSVNIILPRLSLSLFQTDALVFFLLILLSFFDLRVIFEVVNWIVSSKIHCLNILVYLELDTFSQIYEYYPWHLTLLSKSCILLSRLENYFDITCDL